MRTLRFIINNQTLQKHPECDFSGLVAGSIGYLKAGFKFSDDWNGYLKVAVFSDKDKEYPVPVYNNYCEVPAEVLDASSFKLRVVGKRGDARLSSSRITIIQRRH